MPPSTIPSTSSAISSPGRRFGSSDQGGAMVQCDHGGMTTVRAPVFRLERLNLTVPSHGIGQRIERVADQSKNLLDADALKHTDQGLRDCLSHVFLLCGSMGLSSV